MSIHYITGSAPQNKGSAIQMPANSTSRSDIVEVAQVNPGKRDSNSLANKDVGTIKRSGTGSVLDVVSANGNYAFELSGATPAVGNNFYITGASYPLNGPYGVVGTSGAFHLTDVTYVSCTGLSVTGALYTMDSGTLDPIQQREYLIMGYTTSVGGFSNDALKLNKSNGSDSLHQFNNYRSRVYATGWQSFTGSVSPCDITSTTVSLSTDDAVSGHTVIVNVAGNPKAGDITNPDTTGLRAPA